VGPNRLAVSFSRNWEIARASCQRPDALARFERALAEVSGQTIRIEFNVTETKEEPSAPKVAAPSVSPQTRLQEAAKLPLVCRATELFGAQPTGVEEG
jgi:hypothetical protein